MELFASVEKDDPRGLDLRNHQRAHRVALVKLERALVPFHLDPGHPALGCRVPDGLLHRQLRRLDRRNAGGRGCLWCRRLGDGGRRLHDERGWLDLRLRDRGRRRCDGNFLGRWRLDRRLRDGLGCRLRDRGRRRRDGNLFGKWLRLRDRWGRGSQRLGWPPGTELLSRRIRSRRRDLRLPWGSARSSRNRVGGRLGRRRNHRRRRCGRLTGLLGGNQPPEQASEHEQGEECGEADLPARSSRRRQGLSGGNQALTKPFHLAVAGLFPLTALLSLDALKRS